MTILTSCSETKINILIQSLTKETKSDCTGGRRSDAVRYCQSGQSCCFNQVLIWQNIREEIWCH